MIWHQKIYKQDVSALTANHSDVRDDTMRSIKGVEAEAAKGNKAILSKITSDTFL